MANRLPIATPVGGAGTRNIRGTKMRQRFLQFMLMFMLMLVSTVAGKLPPDVE